MDRALAVFDVVTGKRVQIIRDVPPFMHLEYGHGYLVGAGGESCCCLKNQADFISKAMRTNFASGNCPKRRRQRLPQILNLTISQTLEQPLAPSSNMGRSIVTCINSERSG